MLSLVAAYPSVTGLTFSALLWRRSDYTYDARVKGALGVGLAFPIVAAIGAAVIYPSFAALILGGFACFYAATLYVLFLLVVWVRSNFFLRRPYRLSLVVVVLFAAGVAAVTAVGTGEYFVGVSTAWLALALLCILYGLTSLIGTSAQVTAFSPSVLPTYQLAIDSRELTAHNRPVVALVVGTCALVLWGLVASKHVAPAALGVGVTCASGLFLSLVAGNASTSLRRQLAEVADFLDVGTVRSLRDRTVDLCKQTNEVEEEGEEGAEGQSGGEESDTAEAEEGDAGGAIGGRGGFVEVIRKRGDSLSESQLASALDSLESYIPELGFLEDSTRVLASAVPAMTQELAALSRAVHEASTAAKARAMQAFALYKDRVDRQFALEIMFEVHFTQLAVMAGRYLRQQFERDLREFVMSLGLGDVSPAEIASWPPAMRQKLGSYLLQRRAEQKRRRDVAARERKKRDQSEGTRVAVNVCDTVIPIIDSGDEQYVRRKVNDIVERCKATAVRGAPLPVPRRSAPATRATRAGADPSAVVRRGVPCCGVADAVRRPRLPALQGDGRIGRLAVSHARAVRRRFRVPLQGRRGRHRSAAGQHWKLLVHLSDGLRGWALRGAHHLPLSHLQRGAGGARWVCVWVCVCRGAGVQASRRCRRSRRPDPLPAPLSLCRGPAWPVLSAASPRRSVVRCPVGHSHPLEGQARRLRVVG